MKIDGLFTKRQRWRCYKNRHRVCERCGETEGVKIESSRTAYNQPDTVVRDSFKDANRGIGLCRGCAEEHHEYWNDMWSNVPGY